MAKANAKAVKLVKDLEEGFELPAGYERVNALDGVQLWGIFKAGEVVAHGELLGRHTLRKPGRDGKMRAYYQIRLFEKTKCNKGKGDEKEIVDVAAGEVINVDEKAGLTGLRAYLEDGKRHGVFIRAVEKKDIEDGNTFWRCAVGHSLIEEE